MERRGLLLAGIGAIGGAIGAGLGWLGAAFVRATSRWPARTATKWAAVCKLSDLKEGEPFAASFAFERLEGWYAERIARQVYVVKSAAGEPTVFSRRCSHLGCQVRWHSDAFRCPCHRGIFDLAGRVVSGAPKLPLDVLRSRVAGDVVEVEEA